MAPTWTTMILGYPYLPIISCDVVPRSFWDVERWTFEPTTPDSPDLLRTFPIVASHFLVVRFPFCCWKCVQKADLQNWPESRALGPVSPCLVQHGIVHIAGRKRFEFQEIFNFAVLFFSSRKMRVGWIWNCHQYENRQGHLMTFKVECPKERAWCPIIAQTWFKMSGEMSSFIWWISGCLLLESPCQTASQNMVEPQGRLGFLCFSLEDHSIQNTPSLLPGSCLHKKAGAQFRTNGLV